MMMMIYSPPAQPHPWGGASKNVCVRRAQGLPWDGSWRVWTSIRRVSGGAGDGPGTCGLVPLCAPLHGRDATGLYPPPLLVVTMRFFGAGGMTGGSGVHPMGLVRVPVVAPTRSIGKSEWRPHSSAMDGSRTGPILRAARRDGRCGEEENIGATQCGEPRQALVVLSFGSIDMVSPQRGVFY